MGESLPDRHSSISLAGCDLFLRRVYGEDLHIIAMSSATASGGFPPSQCKMTASTVL